MPVCLELNCRSWWLGVKTEYFVSNWVLHTFSIITKHQAFSQIMLSSGFIKLLVSVYYIGNKEKFTRRKIKNWIIIVADL